MVPTTQRPVVVGIDDSPHAAAALRAAVEEARLRGTWLRVVHAWQPPFVDAFPYASPVYDPEAMDASSRRFVEAAVAEAVTGPDAPYVEQVVVCGSAAATLLEHSRDACLLVVGSRGLGGVRSALLGSVSRQVLHEARCPVLVVHADPTRTGDGSSSQDSTEHRQFA